MPLSYALTAFVLLAAIPAVAQDDLTTHNAASSWAGGYITGPASNPLSFLNGPAYRTYGSVQPYDLPDFHPASLLDRQLPRWIGFGWEERIRVEGKVALLRSRVQMTLGPAAQFKLVAQVQDARPFQPPYAPPNRNAWDLKLAYAEFGDPESQWYSLRVGRQLINYNNTLIADSEWRNQARSYDAAVANLHRGRYRLGLFAASVVVPLADGVSHHRDGNDIYGAYGGIGNIVRDSVLEPFLLWRVQPVGAGKQNERALGFRFKGRTLGSLDYSLELVDEFGSDGPDEIRAWAATFGAGYRFTRILWKPRVFWQYDRASGDTNPADRVHGTFDTMYPTAHDRFGITDQFGWQNIVANRAGLTVEPHRRWTLTCQYLDFHLASATDAVYNTSGIAFARDPGGKSGTDLGREADVYTWYELNRHVNIGFGAGRFMGGEFLRRTTKTPNDTYPYFAVNFKDDGKSR